MQYYLSLTLDIASVALIVQGIQGLNDCQQEQLIQSKFTCDVCQPISNGPFEWNVECGISNIVCLVDEEMHVCLAG